MEGLEEMKWKSGNLDGGPPSPSVCVADYDPEWLIGLFVFFAGPA